MSLSPEEKRYYGALYKSADSEKLGIITGEIAVKFFEKSNLPAATLGQIWEISDKENSGFLTQQSFSVALRLIGQAQNGRSPDAALAKQPGPLPKFEGFDLPSSRSSAPTPPKSRNVVPALTPEDRAKYMNTWQTVSPTNEFLAGERARDVFGKANLSNEQLGEIWALTDTQVRGQLDSTEFIVAMHLIQSVMNGSIKILPAQLPPALFEAAAKGPSARAQRQQSSTSSIRSQEPLQQQYSGQRQTIPMRSQLTGPPGRSSPGPVSPTRQHLFQPPPASRQIQSPPVDWDVKPHEKANYDTSFNDIDTSGKGFITGDEAVTFFLQSKLPEDVLANVWDLSDLNNSGMLDKESFAVAMHLIKGKLVGKELPRVLPLSLVPPSARPTFQSPTAAVFAEAQAQTKQSPVQPSSAAADLFGLNDSFSQPQSKSPPAAVFSDFSSRVASPPNARATAGARGFVPSSSFGQSIQAQQPVPSASSLTAEQDLMSQADPDEAKSVNNDATELANISNQISSLQTQSVQVKQERGRIESGNSRMKAQKDEITAKLAQIRQLYDQEVNVVRGLQSEQSKLQAETRELSKEASLLEASLSAVKQQHDQIGSQLDTDRKENAAIKERIKSANDQTAQLKATLEKVKKDAKQQRGLVAINTKQLNTQEAEHEKLNKQIEDEQKALEADRITAIEQERSKANLEQKMSAFSPPRSTVTMPISSPMSPASMSNNPFHRVSSPATTAVRSIKSPFDENKSFPFNTGSAFIAPAAAGAALGGISAGAAAVAFGHQGTDEPFSTDIEHKASSSEAPINPSQLDQDDEQLSSYDTAPTTANSHPDLAGQNPATAGLEQPAQASQSLPTTFLSPSEQGPSEALSERTVQAPQTVTPQAQNWSGMDPFTADPRIASPAPQEIKPRPAAVSNLAIPSNTSDDESVGTSVIANAPASVRETPMESRTMTPSSLSGANLDRSDSTTGSDPGTNTKTQEASHAEHELTSPVTADSVQNTLQSPSTAATTSLPVPGSFPTGSTPHSSEDEFTDARHSPAEESSDDDTVEQPGVRSFDPYSAKASSREIDSESTHTLTTPTVGASDVESQSAVTTPAAASPSASSGTNIFSAFAHAVGFSNDSSTTPAASQAKGKEKAVPDDDFDEFDDLEEAPEADEDEDHETSFSTQDLDQSFDAPAAQMTYNNGYSTPTRLAQPRKDDIQVSPARDFSEFAHYGSVLGDPAGLAAPIQDTSSLDASAAKATATTAAPPAPAPSRHGAALAAPPSKLSRQLSAADDPMLTELMDMGFDRQKSVSALEKFNYDLGAATDYLLKGN